MGRKKLRSKWFDEYHELVAKPIKVGEATMYVQASRLKIVAVDLLRLLNSPSTRTLFVCWV